jgi:hypothetical protein
MTDNDDIRPTPEAMLKLANAEEVTAELGKLKIYLAYRSLKEPEVPDWDCPSARGSLRHTEAGLVPKTVQVAG